LYQEIQSKQISINIFRSELENKTKVIENLNLIIKSKEDLIKTLQTRLGLAESEIQGLLPIIKRYRVVGILEGEGVVIPIEVKITNGTGVVSVDIKNVEFLSEIQESIRIAVDVAQTRTNTDLSNKDITISFINDRPEIVSIDGPSAGAAITTTIIAAAENKTANEKILVTGTIEKDGSIGRVGGIEQKALAAANYGASIFLVPKGQKIEMEPLQIVEVKNIIEVSNLVLS